MGLSTDLDFFEVLQTQPSTKAFKTDPVPDQAIRTMIEAATWAPNSGNRQTWEFVVVKDADTRIALGDIYRKGFQMLLDNRPPRREMPEARTLPRSNISRSMHLANTIHEAPVHIVVCMHTQLMPFPDGILKGFAAETVYTGSVPAVQNLMLAARAIGLGTCLTTALNLFEGDAKTLLGIPSIYQVVALIPVGYPEREFKRVSRLPSEEKTHWDHW